MSHCTWEKEVNAFRNGVQDAPDTDEYIRENLPRLLSKAIASAVEARENQISSAVRKMSDGQEHETNEHYLGFEEAIDKILSIINPSKE